MFAGNWFGKRLRLPQRAQRQSSLKKGIRRKDVARFEGRALRMEALEDRRLLATYIVNNTDDIDDGNVVVGSLRQAINLSNASPDITDTIVFADFVFTDPITGLTLPQTIALDGGAAGGQLTISDDVQILGPGADALTIQAGAGNHRIFDIDDGNNDERRGVTIGGVTLTGGTLTGTGEESRGGAIRNSEALTLIETVVAFNSASRGGGGIFQDVGSLTVQRSVISNNSSSGGGGGILSGTDGSDPTPSVFVTNSTISGNNTGGAPMLPGFGGGVFTRNGTTTIQNSTITGNFATAGGGGVATYGLPLDAEPGTPSITTSLTHTIAYGNFSNDLVAVFVNIDGDVIVPNLQVLDYNIIGSIGNSVVDPLTGHLYEVVSVPAGIDWNLANQLATGPGNSSHLATPSTVDENDLIFGFIDDPLFWREFEVTEEMAPAGGTIQNIGPWIGGVQFDTMAEPNMGWEWVTEPDPLDPDRLDEPFADFNPPTGPNWAVGEPDDGANLFDPASPPDPLIHEDRLAYFTPNSTVRENTWGDLPVVPEEDGQLPVAFVIEYEPTVSNNMFGVDPLLQSDFGAPVDVGGATSVFYLGPGSPALDAGDPLFTPNFFDFEQRGRHFTRVAGAAIDIGSVEVQQGQFRVDTLVDESDLQYSRVWENIGVLFGDIPVGYEFLGTTGGDFSLREALEFSEKNPEIDTIFFEPVQNPDILLSLDDPTTSSLDPTILLTLRADANSALSINHTVNIVGPTGFVVELDASGNDLTPFIDNNDGTRIFSIDDGDLLSTVDVSISNLTLLGADVVDSGGAIRSLENLTLSNSTLKENAASNDGGGIFSQIGNLIIDSSTLHNNHSGDDGAAIFVDTSTPGNVTTATIRNSTISGNISGSQGGGIYNYNGEVLVEFSTVTLNTAASGRGAGIASLPGVDALTQVRSSVVSENIGEDIEFLFGATNIQSLGFNLIGNGNAAVVFNQPGDMTGVLDAKLAPLLNTGGLVATHRLLPGSVAIDAGDTFAVAGVGGVPMFDQRGSLFTRVFDGLQDTKDRIDIGAYEIQPTTFIVDSLGDENDGDISIGNFSLREAVQAANANPLTDTIVFDPILLGGTIFQSAKNGFTLQPGTPTDIRITDSVNIIGLGKSFLTLDGSGAFTDLSITPPIGEPFDRTHFFTVDDGNAGTDIQVTISDLKFQNSFDTTENGGALKSLEDLTLDRVSFIANSTLGDGNNGGAIYQRNGSLVLNNVTLSANSTDGEDADGGAVYVRDADLTIVNNSSISGNSTTQTLGNGGGVYLRGGTLNMSYSSISSNLAPGGEADGGGLFGYQAVLNIIDSTITGNSMTGSNSEGAGIFSKDSALTFTNSILGLNSTTGTQSEGAGLYLSGETATFDNSTISLNSSTGLTSVGGGIAVVSGGQLDLHQTTVTQNTTTGIDASGGGIHNLSSVVVVRDSTIVNNSVSGVGAKGGGVYSDTNLLGTELTTVLNSTVSGNSSNVAGGGVYNADGVTRIQHSTITNNSGPIYGFGGGVASYGNASTRTEIESSIISGNATSDVDRVTLGPTPAESFLSLGYNIVGTGLSTGAFSAGLGDQIGANPMLAAIADNGGPTQTHALLNGSPAIDFGNPLFDPQAFTTPLTSDQRGGIFSRVVQGQIDIGAFEVQPKADFDEDGDVDGFDFLSWQRGFNTINPDKEDGDADGDNDVDGTDLGIWQQEFGGGTVVVASLAASAAPATAPPVVEIEGAASSASVTAIPLLESSSVVEGSLALESRPASATANVVAAATATGPNSNALSGLTFNLAGLFATASSEMESEDYVDRTVDAFEVAASADNSLALFLTAASHEEFSDIATSSSVADDATYAAEDHLFDLLGSEIL